MNLIGISGTNGSGKDSLGELLQEKYGWLFLSGSEILREELRRRGLPTERQNMRTLSTEWRREFGVGALIDKVFEIYKSHQKEYAGLVVASLRNPGEADEVHKLGGKVVWLDADPKIRYQRISSRMREDDKKTYEQFLQEEQDEMEHSGDHHTLSLSGVKERSDIFLQNNGTLEEFEAAAKRSLDL